MDEMEWLFCWCWMKIYLKCGYIKPVFQRSEYSGVIRLMAPGPLGVEVEGEWDAGAGGLSAFNFTEIFLMRLT